MVAATPASWALTAVFAILFVVCGLRFAQFQNIWIDESTQLLGSRLPLGTMFDWLAGHGPRLGVPEDRMPPVSYLIDATCWAAGCGGDLSFRYLHLAIAAIGVAVAVHLAASRLGTAAAVVAGAFLVLSPQVTAVAVEIRAYPIFLAEAAITLALFWRLIEVPELTARRLVPFWAISVLASYTHFFGLVMAGSYCAALFVARVRSRGDALRVVALGILILLPAIGLAPFIFGARAASDLQSASGTSAAQVVQYLLRLLAGPETLIVTPLAILYFAAVAVLLGVAVWRIGTQSGDWRSATATPIAGVAVALAAGVAISIAGALLLKGFDPLKPSYSVWMLPAIAILLGSACASAMPRRPYRLGLVAAGGLVVALLGVMGVFWTHAAWFVHGPERQIAAMVPSRDTAVVYDGPSWAYGFFPLVYRFGTSFAQYQRADDGTLRPIRPGGGVASRPVAATTLDQFAHVVAVRIDLDSYRDLAARLEGQGEEVTPPLGLPGWRKAGERQVEGFYGARIVRFDKGER